jgi:hypothetical protein
MAVDNTAEVYTQLNTTLAVKTAFDQLQAFLNGILETKEITDEHNMEMMEHVVQINNQVKRLANIKS